MSALEQDTGKTQKHNNAMEEMSTQRIPVLRGIPYRIPDNGKLCESEHFSYYLTAKRQLLSAINL